MKSNKHGKNNYNKSNSKPSNGVNKKGRSIPAKSDCVTNDVHISGDVNDASYYFSNELLKNQLSNISFSNFTGVPVRLENQFVGDSQNVKIPTSMVIKLNPSAGFTDETDGLGSALNLASLKLYTELSANNAKTTNYAPQDVTTLFLALGSAISLSSHISRIFGLAYLYSQRNRSYPRGIIHALGVDYDDLMANYANYRARFNTIMNAASAISFPQNVAYFKKCTELYSGIYLDMEGSAMAQTYAFAPYSVWYFDETGTEEGTVLRTYGIHDSDDLKTMNFLLSQLDTIFTALLNSATLNYIYSDILRLADKGLPLYTFALIPDNYVVLPAYNPEIRKWINNLSPIGKPKAEAGEGYTNSNNVYPDADTNKIVYRPQFSISFAGQSADRILNFDYGTFTADDIVYATRLMAGLEFEVGSTDSKRAALPDHYVVELVIYYNDQVLSAIGTTSLAEGLFELGLQLSAFDWAPILLYETSSGIRGVVGDLNYYTTVDYDYLSTLQDATYYGLFEIR